MRVFAGSVVALGLGLMVEAAKAEQTFICDDGRLLKVEHHEVDRLKRSDPCVAAYFGLSVVPMPLPVKRPAPAAALPLKGSQSSEAIERGPADIALVDYRNVRIINAAPGSGGWYRHTR